MSERSLKQLVGALAVVAVLWAVASLIGRGGGAIDAPTELGAVFEGVDPSSVTAVRFIGREDTIELVPGADTWRVNGFRADSGSVARFFDSVAETSLPSTRSGMCAARMPVNASSSSDQRRLATSSHSVPEASE